MQKRKTLVVLPLTFAAASACAPAVTPARTVDLSPLAVDGWRGMSLEGDRFHLVAEGRGVLELSKDGALLGEHKVGEQGLLDMPYRDVAAINPGASGSDPLQYLLIADNEGYLWDPASERQDVRFCVEPGFTDPGDPSQPVLQIVQKNDALAVSSGLIVANPRFYEIVDGEERQTSSELRTYQLVDGQPISSVLLDEMLELRGLAVTTDEILGVTTDTMHRFTHDGEPLGTVHLDGVTGAAGVTLDGESLWVLDEETDAIVQFALDDLE